MKKKQIKKKTEIMWIIIIVEQVRLKINDKIKITVGNRVHVAWIPFRIKLEFRAHFGKNASRSLHYSRRVNE